MKEACSAFRAGERTWVWVNPEPLGPGLGFSGLGSLLGGF